MSNFDKWWNNTGWHNFVNKQQSLYEAQKSAYKAAIKCVRDKHNILNDMAFYSFLDEELEAK